MCEKLNEIDVAYQRYTTWREDMKAQDRERKLALLRATAKAREGDIVIDHYHAIRVTRVVCRIASFIEENIGYIVYEGVGVRKDGANKKVKSIERVYQQNIQMAISCDIPYEEQKLEVRKYFSSLKNTVE